MNLKMKTLAAAVIATAAMSTANANSLLFPYFTTANGAQSVLSVSASGTAAVPETLHYVYNYGPACTHFDGNGSVTPNDLMQHSLLAPAAGGFGEVVADTSNPFYIPLRTEGFLTVTSTTPGAGIIAGDMVVADPSVGLMLSYAGITNGAGAEGDYSAVVANDLIPVPNIAGTLRLSWYANAIANTSWYNVVLGNMNAAIIGNRDWTATTVLSNGGIVYDNDENPFSGTVSKTTRCSGNIRTADLMNSAQVASVTNGAVLPLPVFADGDATDLSTSVVMTKMQAVLPAVGAPYAGTTLMHREVQAN